MPECSRGGRACTSGREEEEEEGGQKKAGDKRGQFRSQQKLLKSKPAPDHKIKKRKKMTALHHPREDRRTDHLSLESSQKQ